jgi:hypothetical protein
MIIVGLDVGRGSAVACVLDGLPKDLAAFIRTYKPVTFKTCLEDLEKLVSLGDIFALEPTGKDHRWWQQQLESRGKTVFLCAGVRVRNYARNHGISSKGDKEDAAAIACFCLHNLETGNLRAFQKSAGSEIQDLRRELLNCQCQRTRIICQLKSRLATEAPEHCKLKATERPWGCESRSNWRKLAEVEGLSWQSLEDIEQIIYWDNRECRTENQISELLATEEFQLYHQRLSEWEFSERLLTPIIAAVHPIEQFLSEDGRRIIERQHTLKGSRSKLDRSLRGLHRALGYGRLKIQSGDSWKWARTGDRTILSALYIWLEMKVVIRRTPSRSRLATLYDAPDFAKLTPKARKEWIDKHNFRSFCVATQPQCEAVRPLNKQRQRVGYQPWKDQALIESVCNYSLCNRRVAELQLFYEFGFFEIGKHERILKVLPYFIRLLANDLFYSDT